MSDPRDQTVNTHETASAALDLLQRGWQPIPVPRASKAPTRLGWQNLRLSVQEIAGAFGRGENVGVLNGEPSGWRVDVDLDWIEAVALAPALLPATASIFGRPGKRRSHYGYIAQGAVTLQLEDPTSPVDPKMAMIVELRASRTQTIFPPSVHPSGERSVWDVDGAPAETDALALRAAVLRLGAASLIARHWQGGLRHRLALPVAGALLRKMPLEDALAFVDTVARAAGDEEVEQRLADVRTTAARIGAGEPATGIPTLAQIIPHAAADRFELWLDRAAGTRPTDDRALAEHDAEPGHKRQRKSQATELVELADSVELFHTPDIKPYATVAVGDHVETCSLRGQAMRRWLSHRYYLTYGKAPAQSAVQDGLGVLEGRALYDGPQIPVFVRMAEQNQATYIDLADERWRCVEVTPAGWHVVERPPVRFRRPRGMAALPEPISGGDVGDLRGFVNVRDDDQFALLVAFVIAALRAHGPYAVLNITAEQGSGKSTTQRVIRALTDPSTTPVRAEPRDVRDLMIAATNSWVASFDNVSHLPVWLSDAICRLSTGGGFATRELFSDDEEALFEVQRPVMLNGIEELAVRPDLLDRTIILNLPRIPEHSRRTEAAFWDEFARAGPRILGGLLSAVSAGLANLATTRLARLPRLADMALWVVAAEPALPWAPGTFIAAYSGSRTEANDLALEASPVAPALRRIDSFTGTATELLALLGGTADDDVKRQRGWPKNAHGLSNVLRRLAPNLRAVGVNVEFARDGQRRTISVSTDRHEPGEPDGKTASAASSASRATRPPEHAPRNDPVDDAPADADDAARSEDLRPGRSDDADDACDAEIPALSQRTCRSCGGTEFWIGPGGGYLCASCHPPVDVS